MTRVLIVDDNEQNTHYLRALLEGHDFEVAVAGHGEEALAAAADEPPAIIVSDVLMPGMDGFALCRAHEAPPTCPTKESHRPNRQVVDRHVAA